LVLKINTEAETITTVFISQFGAIQKGFSVPYQQGQLHLFDKGVSMYELLEKPFDWGDFMKQFS
jgi:hypothetical protein